MTSCKLERLAVGAALLLAATGLTTAVSAQDASSEVPAPASELQQAYTDLDQAWSAAPLAFTTVTFATAPAAGYGKYEPRGSNSFKTGETITVYAEPVGYGFEETANGYKHDLSVGFRLANTTGQILAEEKAFASFAGETRAKVRQLPASLTFGFQGLPGGSYVLHADFTDLVGGKSATASLPFTVEGAN